MIQGIPRANRHRKQGFTLVEMAIVLVIVGIVAWVSMGAGMEALEQARHTQTRMKLDKIEEALASYRRDNDRLPCPASLTLADTDGNHGVTAANPGRCTGGTPAATYADATAFAAEGAVPFKELKLAPDFMFDAWGKRILYAVDMRMTEVEAFGSYDIFDNCGGITVRDMNGNNRTAAAIYALTSTGPNGHGGFDAAGNRTDAASTNTDEQLNCNCNGSGVYDGTYNPTYVQKNFTGTGTDVFDDIVRFKERWQIQTQADTGGTPYNGPEVMLALSGSPYLKFYSKTCDSYAEFNDVTGSVSSQANAAAVSPNNNYWAVAHSGSPFLTVFKRNAMTGALTTSGVTISHAPPNQAHGLAFSRGGRYLAVGHYNAGATAGGITVYTVNNETNTFTRLVGDPTLSSSWLITELAFSPNDIYLAGLYADSSPYMKIYRRSDDAFTELNLGVKMNTPPAGQSWGVDFSADGKYMAVGHTGSPYFSVYAINTANDTFTKTADPASLPPGGTTLGAGVSFSKDSRYLAVSTDNGTNSGSIFIYKIDSSQSPPLTLVTGSGTNYDQSYPVLFSPRQPFLYSGASGLGIGNYAAVLKYIPIEDYFSLRAANTLPSPGVAPYGVAARHKQ